MADARRVAIVPLPVVRDPTLSDNAKIVALGLGAFMDASGRCYPGIDTLATFLGRSPSSVYRGLAELTDHKHLTRKRLARKPSILAWCHPMIGQTGELTLSMIGQPGEHDRSGQRKKAAMIGQSGDAHIKRARVTRTTLTRTTGNEEKNLLSEDEKKPTAPDPERPVFDLTRRQDRGQPPAPLAASLTHFLTRPGG